MPKWCPLLQAVVKLSPRQRAELILLTRLFLSDRTCTPFPPPPPDRGLIRCWAACQESLDEQAMVQLRKMLLHPPAARAAAYELAQLTEELHVRGPCLLLPVRCCAAAQCICSLASLLACTQWMPMAYDVLVDMRSAQH